MASARKVRPPVAANGDGWLSVHEAKRMLGITYHKVVVRAARGEFKTKVFAGRMWVWRDDVERAAAAADAATASAAK